jgi:hypothetical protein
LKLSENCRSAQCVEPPLADVQKFDMRALRLNGIHLNPAHPKSYYPADVGKTVLNGGKLTYGANPDHDRRRD